MAYYELKLSTSLETDEFLIDMLTQKGCLGFREEENLLTAYFGGNFDMQGLIQEIGIINELREKAAMNALFTFSYTLLPDQDWNETWKKKFIPLDVGKRFTILPPWERQTPGRINLIIDPGMAFGTGHHETTRSCLVLMEKYDRQVTKDHFLDLGTGSGLLAIAASKMGYSRIIAVDTDPLAASAARMNAALNQAPNVEVREGSITAVSNSFDCITANIISGVLIQLASDIAVHLKRSGVGILSGILADQADEVASAIQKAGLRVKERFQDGKWISLVASRNSSARR